MLYIAPSWAEPWMPTQKYTTKSTTMTTTTTTTPPGDAFSIHPQSIPLRVGPCSIRTYRPYTWDCRCWRQNSGNGMFVNGVAICDVIWWGAGLSISELWVQILRRIKVCNRQQFSHWSVWKYLNKTHFTDSKIIVILKSFQRHSWTHHKVLSRSTKLTTRASKAAVVVQRGCLFHPASS